VESVLMGIPLGELSEVKQEEGIEVWSNLKSSNTIQSSVAKLMYNSTHSNQNQNKDQYRVAHYNGE